jgi:hypothetical protein
MAVKIGQQGCHYAKLNNGSNENGDDDGDRSGAQCTRTNDRNNMNMGWNKDSSERTGADSNHRDNN